MDTDTRTAIVTGGSRGFGREVALLLAEQGWHVVIDGRDAGTLERTARELGPTVIPLAGDVADPHHRLRLVDAAAETGRLDLLLNNASELGPSPLPLLADHPIDALARIFEVNILAPVGLIQLALPTLAPGGAVISVTSDAAVEPYETWGGYGASKAALDHASRILAAELAASRPDTRVWTLDPGDMRTDMHQAAFPGEDISDRADPAEVAPAVLRLLTDRPPSGRLRAADLLEVAAR